MKRMMSVLLWIGIIASCVWGAVGAQAGTDPDLQRLQRLSDELIQGTARVTLKSIHSYKPCVGKEAFLRNGQLLSQRLGLPVMEDAAAEGDHLLYKASRLNEEGIRLTLLWVGFMDGTTEMIVSAETTDGAGVRAAAAEQRRLTASLKALGLKPQWNTVVQGTLKAGYAETSAREAWLTQQLNSEEVSRYEDRGSLSIAYRTPRIEAAAGSGSEQINLQVAVHRHSQTGEQRITLGAPLITTEY